MMEGINDSRRMGATVRSPTCDTGASHLGSSTLEGTSIVTESLRRLLEKRHSRFLAGPIPLVDLSVAARMPGQALAVLLLVHHRAKLTREDMVRLPSGLLAEFGIDKDGKARALRRLEAAGLVRVERATGRAARIRLVPGATRGSAPA